jgi:hypothetical protein
LIFNDSPILGGGACENGSLMDMVKMWVDVIIYEQINVLIIVNVKIVPNVKVGSNYHFKCN